MNRKLKILISILLLLLPVFSFKSKTNQDNPVNPGATLEKLAGGFLFTEGPASDSNGNVCFGDPDGKSLFITASTGLYRIRMQVIGADR
jgi:gluconolactonase